MAIITCPECGRDVSDHAKHCPHCGNTISRGSVFYTSIVVGTVIALLGIFTGLYIAHDRQAESGDTDQFAADSLAIDSEMPNSQLQTSNLQADSLDWTAAQEENTFESYLAYLQRHPDGTHSFEARDLLEALAGQLVHESPDSIYAVQPDDTLQPAVHTDTLDTPPSDTLSTP